MACPAISCRPSWTRASSRLRRALRFELCLRGEGDDRLAQLEVCSVWGRGPRCLSSRTSPSCHPRAWCRRKIEVVLVMRVDPANRKTRGAIAKSCRSDAAGRSFGASPETIVTVVAMATRAVLRKELRALGHGIGTQQCHGARAGNAGGAARQFLHALGVLGAPVSRRPGIPGCSGIRCHGLAR